MNFDDEICPDCGFENRECECELCTQCGTDWPAGTGAIHHAPTDELCSEFDSQDLGMCKACWTKRGVSL